MAKSNTLSELLEQIQAEKNVSENYANKKRNKWKKQFKLLYNERKREDMVGDELMWSTTDTIISSLQEDSMIHEFYPTEAWDIETCEVLNAVMTIDWNKMEMDDIHDITATWAVYVGRCVVDCSEISKITRTIKPRFINPLLEYVDPYAVCMHWIWESKERWARWYGYALPTTRGIVEKKFGESEKYEWETDGQKALKVIRKLWVENVATGENTSCTLLVWYTRWKGKNVRVLCNMQISEILGILEVGNAFPLFDPSIGMGDEWYPRSAMDMIEDKHKTRASIANTAKELIIEQLSPIGLVKTWFPAHQLENAESGDILEVDDPNSVRFIEKPRLTNDSMWLLESLQRQAEDVLSVPEIQRWVQMNEQRTASELSILSSASRRRYGRTAKSFQKAYKKFWEIWYWAYQKYWDDKTYQKTLKISGVYGPQWRNITRRDITLKADLDIRIESKSENEQKKIQKTNQLLQFHQLSVADPNYQVREGIRMIAKNMNIGTQEFNVLFPKSTDELEAEAENEILSKNQLVDGEKKVEFNIHQDHDAHIREHMKGKMTEAMRIHIEKHYEAKRLIRDQAPMLAGMWFAPNNQNTEMQENASEQEVSMQEFKTPLWLPIA